MINACNDGTAAAPYLRLDINSGNLFGLPPESSGPIGDDLSKLRAAKAAGFVAVQGADPALARAAGLRHTAGGRVNTVAEALPAAEAAAAAGADCLTLHVGWGMEDDATIDALLIAILRAQEQTRMPTFVETHRATITQDIWRTVQMVRRFPDLRFNGDFSHWYTGLEMVYGDWAEKIAFLAPVFERVRFIHGRIGNPGCMQVDIDTAAEPEGRENRPHVGHFRELWTHSFVGFLRSAKPGDYLPFTPELLVPLYYYARLIRGADGQAREEGDRWQQALKYCTIAKECWAEAQRIVTAWVSAPAAADAAKMR